MKKAAFFLLLIAIWAAVSSSGLFPRYLFPGPWQVATSDVITGGSLPLAIGASLQRLALGYALALTIGLLIGALLAASKAAERLLSPYIAALQAIPSVAWLPLAVLWLGISEAAIISIVFLGGVWSIAVNTQAGFANVPPLLVRAGRTMGADGARLFTSVVLPAALPQILSGWRLAWGFAWRSLMAGELLSPGRGLGEALLRSRNTADMASVVAVIIAIGLIGSLIDNLFFLRLERRTRQRWGLTAA